jgi:hypothetical protein
MSHKTIREKQLLKDRPTLPFRKGEVKADKKEQIELIGLKMIQSRGLVNKRSQRLSPHVVNQVYAQKVEELSSRKRTMSTKRNKKHNSALRVPVLVQTVRMLSIKLG